MSDREWQACGTPWRSPARSAGRRNPGRGETDRGRLRQAATGQTAGLVQKTRRARTSECSISASAFPCRNVAAQQLEKPAVLRLELGVQLAAQGRSDIFVAPACAAFC